MLSQREYGRVPCLSSKEIWRTLPKKPLSISFRGHMTTRQRKWVTLSIVTVLYGSTASQTSFDSQRSNRSRFQCGSSTMGHSPPPGTLWRAAESVIHFHVHIPRHLYGLHFNTIHSHIRSVNLWSYSRTVLLSHISRPAQRLFRECSYVTVYGAHRESICKRDQGERLAMVAYIGALVLMRWPW